MPELTAEFDLVRAANPGDHVIDNMRGPGSLVQGT